jgi:hypothetical protein
LLHRFFPLITDEINIGHEIKQLSFGDHFPGIENPLDSTNKQFSKNGGVYQYYV